MTFPTTGILDSFNRADAGPPPSADWSIWQFNDQFRVLSNQATAQAGASSELVANYWDTSTFGADTEAYTTIAAPNGDGSSSYGVIARIQTGDLSDGYLVEWTAGNTIDIYRIDNGAYTQLGASNTGQTLNAGDKIGIEIIGSTIKAYKNEGAGWSQVGTSRTDSTYSAAGYVGLHCYQGGATLISLDDFGGGTVVVAGGGQPARTMHQFRMRKQ